MGGEIEQVKVWGELACFTSLESPVERISYEVMTPSAARGILESIYWKPEVVWDVHEIWVMNPIKRTSMTKNEINHRQSYRLARQGKPYIANSTGLTRGDPQNRTQRHNVMLKDVCYVINAELVMKPDRSTPNKNKHTSQFRRRVARGACYRRPFLGQKEHAAFFAEAADDDVPIPETRDLGRMLYDIAYHEGGNGTLSWMDHSGPESRIVTGEARPVFFDAALEHGVLRVPSMEWLVRESRMSYEQSIGSGGDT